MNPSNPVHKAYGVFTQAGMPVHRRAQFSLAKTFLDSRREPMQMQGEHAKLYKVTKAEDQTQDPGAARLQC